jgi:integrase
MAKAVRNSKIDSRAARERLRPSGKPVYCDLGSKLHLGYRKGKSGGVWVARFYRGAGKYVIETMAEADDFVDANGAGVLDFRMAQTRARELEGKRAERQKLETDGPPLTVRRLFMEYAEERAARHVPLSGHKHDARNRLMRILAADEAFAAMLAADLTVEGLQNIPIDERTVHDARRAFNRAHERYRDALPSAFRDTIRYGLKGSRKPAQGPAREIVTLSDADVRRLVAAAWAVDEAGSWQGDLGRLVLALASTGARFSQICRITVAGLQPRERRLMIPTSRKGRRSKLTHVAVPVAQDVIDALALAVNGRIGSELLFLHCGWRRVGQTGWERNPERRPWTSPGQLARHWGLIIAAAGLPASTTPYSLRHSSIVRMLRQNLPISLVARVHNTGALQIENHYAAHIATALDDLVAEAVISLAPAPITPLTAVRR